MLMKIRGEEQAAAPEAKEGDRRDSDDGFLNGRPRRSSVGGIRLVRTISTIDGEPACLSGVPTDLSHAFCPKMNFWR